jgi:hypothetical protein
MSNCELLYIKEQPLYKTSNHQCTFILRDQEVRAASVRKTPGKIRPEYCFHVSTISGVFLQDPVAGIFDLGIHRLVIIENKALSTLCFAF